MNDKIDTHVKVVASSNLEKEVAKELEIPDPAPEEALAALGKDEIDEKTKKELWANMEESISNGKKTHPRNDKPGER